MFQAKGISPDIELERLEQAIRAAVPDWSHWQIWSLR
jgi:hypothetical protein